MNKPTSPYLTPAQLRAEIEKCEYCQEKPCREACPADCSPADFIMAAKVGSDADFLRAATLILASNPLGGVCGAVCPDTHCQKACVHENFDRPVRIPAVQATIVRRAYEAGAWPRFLSQPKRDQRLAVVGAGPAGLAAAAALAREGYAVEVLEKEKTAGGMVALIPDFRLERGVFQDDYHFLKRLGQIRFIFDRSVTEPAALLREGYAAVVVATGLNRPLRLGIPGEDLTRDWMNFLRDWKHIDLKGKRVAVIGGGAVAADCAQAAIRRRARSVELICLEKPGEMPLTEFERSELIASGSEVSSRLKASEISADDIRSRKLIRLVAVELPAGKTFSPAAMVEDHSRAPVFKAFDEIIVAIGARSDIPRERNRRIFYAGDSVNGATSVVEAVASGKNGARRLLDFLQGVKNGSGDDDADVKSRLILAGRNLTPVALDAEFFGRPVRSPFLLSASPCSDGYEQMKLAYQAGWAGGVMKTAFDNVPIHIPGEYMFVMAADTMANCDNVSGHGLKRVCGEIGRLVREFPDHLTLASTGGPVTGDDEQDKVAWQSNTRKLEAAGAMGIEYSLSCPQGGDGTKGDIVSQDAKLTAKIVGWVLESTSRPEIPKLFKLTGAVTAIQPIVSAIKKVFSQFPNQRAGITLANSFPGLAWRPGEKQDWDDGVVIGLSGEGILPISNLTLAKVAKMKCPVSGNGGPMNYRQAADFLALGVGTVQFCTLPLKYGYGIIDELHSGLSHLLQARGMKSVSEMIGCALPDPIRGFAELSARKKISAVEPTLCLHCGNCSRCPYLAITLDDEKIPVTDAARCIGCSLCVQLCFAGALAMRPRTDAELAALKED